MKKILISIGLIASIVLFLIIYSDKIFFKLIHGRTTGFEHYKIARDIKDNKKTDLIESMNRWMLENYMTIGINERYIPVLDKGSHFRLIDGYSACDGAADTYIRISEFLELKGYTVPLYDQDGISPHTIVTFITKKNYQENIAVLNSDMYFEIIRDNALVIDPVHNVVFTTTNGRDFASLNDICLNRYNNNEKKYLNVNNNGYVNNDFFCLASHRASENDPINTANLSKKLYYYILDFIPEIILFKLYENYIDQSYKDEDYFLKARSHDLFGNYKLARKYYDLSILKNSSDEHNVFRGIENIEGEYVQYVEKFVKDNPVYEPDYSKFFMALLNNKENNITQKNPFELNHEPFYSLYESYANKRIKYIDLIKN